MTSQEAMKAQLTTANQAIGSSKKEPLFPYPVYTSLPPSFAPPSLTPFLSTYFLLLKSPLSALKESKCPKPLSKIPMCVLIFKCLCGYVTERERRTGERGSSQYVGKCQKPSKSQLLHKTLKSCRKPERREKN